MCPLAVADGHDLQRLIEEFVPSVATVIDAIVVGLEDAVGEPVIAHELPDVFVRVEFGRSGRQGDDRDVGGNGELGGGVPAGLVHDEDGMISVCDGT